MDRLNRPSFRPGRAPTGIEAARIDTAAEIVFIALQMLAKEFLPRRPFKLKRLPLLARFYGAAYHHAALTSSKSRALRALFPIFYKACSSSWGEFDYDRLSAHRTVRFNARNLQFQALYAPFFRSGYEPDVAMLLDVLLPARGTFFDIGSNWGYFTLYAASNRERLTIHAFEPMPQTYRDLISCVDQAGISEMVTAHPLALSNADGEAFIQIPDRLHSGQAMISRSQGTARVATRRLDSMNLPPPDFIKMDVEGHELEVLQSGEETLRAHRPFVVFENKPHDAMPERILEPLLFLHALGYRLYVPALQRNVAAQDYFQPVAGQSANAGDCIVLMPLEAKARLLWQNDLNVFACHESRLAQLAALFSI